MAVTVPFPAVAPRVPAWLAVALLLGLVSFSAAPELRQLDYDCRGRPNYLQDDVGNYLFDDVGNRLSDGTLIRDCKFWGGRINVETNWETN